MHRLLLSIVLLCSSIMSLAINEDRAKPIEIKSEFFELDIESGELLYSGNVELRQGSLVITSAKLRVLIVDGVLGKAEAEGNPATVTDVLSDTEDPNLMIQGDLIEYDARTEQIVVTNNAVIEKGINRLAAYQVFYDIANGVVRAKRGGEGERVNMRFNSPAQ